MLSWILILVGGGYLLITAAGKLVPFVKKLIPSAIPDSVSSTVEKVDDYADMVAGISACFAISAIAKKRGNTELASQVATVRVTLAKLADDTVLPA